MTSPPEPPAEPVWVSTTEAANILGYTSRSSVLRLIHTRELLAHRRGSRYRIPVAELERLRRAPTVTEDGAA
jgi:excisionase family DNA binding protein